MHQEEDSDVVGFAGAPASQAPQWQEHQDQQQLQQQQAGSALPWAGHEWPSTPQADLPPFRPAPALQPGAPAQASVPPGRRTPRMLTQRISWDPPQDLRLRLAGSQPQGSMGPPPEPRAAGGAPRQRSLLSAGLPSFNLLSDPGDLDLRTPMPRQSPSPPLLLPQLPPLEGDTFDQLLRTLESAPLGAMDAPSLGPAEPVVMPGTGTSQASIHLELPCPFLWHSSADPRLSTVHSRACCRLPWSCQTPGALTCCARCRLPRSCLIPGASTCCPPCPPACLSRQALTWTCRLPLALGHQGRPWHRCAAAFTLSARQLGLAT